MSITVSNQAALYEVPILFLVFNQPEITRKVFEAIRRARPAKLYIAADGPRADRPDEAGLCKETRSIVDMIDWECELHTRFLDENLGCKLAVSSGITWFFGHVEEGVILEYDCLPDPTFFEFCRVMLERYRDDHRVFSITGNNFQQGVWRGDGDYYFSRIDSIWGWATWKRTWKHWEPELRNFQAFVQNEEISNLFSSRRSRQTWIDYFMGIDRKTNTSTWSFHLTYAIFVNNGLCVTPNANLVTNIGFGEGATHARKVGHPLANLPTIPLTSCRAPSFVIPCADADETYTRVTSSSLLADRARELLYSTVKTMLPEASFNALRRFKKRFLE